MSYASVTASNISPDSPQPQPDPALLNTSRPEASDVADDTAKVNVVSQAFRENPRTHTSEANRYPNESDGTSSSNSGRRGGDRRLREVKAEGAYLWAALKRFLLRPETAGGCIGLVNLGLLGGLGQTLYIRPGLRRDTGFIFSAVATALGLLAVEGYAAERYRQTPRGRAEERRAKEEGAYLYAKAREVILRPGVLGGLVGVANTAVLGSLGYVAYSRWDQPRWDRRIVSGVAAGLFALFSGEGWLAERFISN